MKADLDGLAFSTAAFISALFLLEYGADAFVDHAAVVANRTGIPPIIIALLTAGAEWEELVVVVASVAQGRPGLAVGNIIGSAISNILGAFSLGLLFYNRREQVEFDRSAKIYSLVLLILTTLVISPAYFTDRTLWYVAGIVLIAVFAIYIFSVVWAIGQSILIAPEDSDSDSDNDNDTDRDSGEEPAAPSGSAADHNHESTETDPLVFRAESAETASLARTSGRRTIAYHTAYLVFGFAAICLAGYILSHAASSIASAAGISDVLFGVIILAITTTLPEKFLAVMSGHRGQPGILIANTVGSNIFLLTLCLGITMLHVSLNSNTENSTVGMAELAVLWGSTICLVLTVWMGGRFHRSTGAAMLLAYVAFIVLEFTVFNIPREMV